LGGGLVPGQVVLMAGEPGIGKSTLLLQVANEMGHVLYVSGEESATQIKIRANRMGIKNKKIDLLEETNIDSIIDTVGSLDNVKALIVDSIQTLTTNDLSGVAGSVGQVRESASRLVHLAKSTHLPIFIVGQVTKQGSVAGPAALAHIVDTVLWFEGDKNQNLRLLRAVKNRFGPTDEVGIFQMEERGLISVNDSSKLFLSNTDTPNQPAGSVATSILEGTRPILVEIQSLVVPTKLAFPKRVAQGIDSRRVEVILAVLTRRSGLSLFEYDVFVNVAGGITVREPGADLAVALSIASSYFDKKLPKNTLAIGEVGLLGEVRPVTAQGKRVKEAKRLGFSNIISSESAQYISQVIHNLRLTRK
jgi:DNA repair protein RadA/Sms